MFRRWMATVATATVLSGTQAEVIEWVGYQGCIDESVDSGSFFHGDNWFGYATPGPLDEALFGSGFDPQENGVNPHYLYFGDYCISTGFGCPNPIAVPGAAASSNRLTIQSGIWTFDFGPGQTGACTRPGAALGSYQIQDWVLVGTGVQDASLTLRGGQLRCGFARLGVNPESYGELILDDARLIVDRDLEVGGDGSGRLMIHNGSAVDITQPLLTGTFGDVLVQGEGTRLTVDLVALGANSGDAIFEVTGGAIVNSVPAPTGGNPGLRIAQAGGSSVVRLAGAGTTWRDMDELLVGSWRFNVNDPAFGQLVIEGGARLECGFSNIGNGNDEVFGEVIVRGRDSEWIARDGAIRCGTGGRGILSVSSGGRVVSPQLDIGVAGSGRLELESPAEIVAEVVTVHAFGLLAGGGSVEADLVNNGEVHVDAIAGSLRVSGGFAQSSDGTLSIEVTDQTMNHLAVAAQAELAGTLALDLSRYSGVAGDRQRILHAAVLAGRFDEVTGLENRGDLAFRIDYLPDGVEVVTRRIGDLNGDGCVDDQDLAWLLARFGTGGADWTEGDLTNNGRVGLEDLGALLAYYGNGC